MQIILLAGGSGKRLWPLSNDKQAKQFLPLSFDLKGTPTSMLERTWMQLAQCGLQSQTIISTSQDQVEQVKAQLGRQVEIIIEPERRDTFAAISLATSYLSSCKKISINEPIVVIPVDLFVDGTFFKHLLSLPQTLEESDANIALVGVKPEGPSENFGYMVPLKGQMDSSFLIDYFREKPHSEEAELLISKGALWNCGVFCFRAGYLHTILQQLKLDLPYELLRESFYKIPRLSFDYRVVEKETKIVASRYEGKWKDLGNWSVLSEQLPDSIYGLAYTSDHCENTHIINELQIPAFVIGIPDAMIIASKDGILIMNKKKSGQIKKMLDKIEILPPHKIPKTEGHILDQTLLDNGVKSITKRLMLKAKSEIFNSIAAASHITWHILQGEATLERGGLRSSITAGDVITFLSGEFYALYTESELYIIEIEFASSMERVPQI